MHEQLLKIQQHHLITPEIRRELFNSVSRGEVDNSTSQMNYNNELIIILESNLSTDIFYD